VGTRYFGGIKLGTGGLVRAYSAAARAALAQAPSEERVWHRLARVTVDYATYSALRHALPVIGAQVRAESFAEQVTLELAVPYDGSEHLAAALRDLTSGRLALEECWSASAGVWLRPAASGGGA
jgi:putative IMPACT (imprinted ancient) family translation regulator